MNKKEVFLKFLNDRIERALVEKYQNIVIKKRVKAGSKIYDELVAMTPKAWEVKKEEIEKLYDENLTLRSLYGYERITQYYACGVLTCNGVGLCVDTEGWC